MQRSSYSQILKSTTLTGGSQLIGIVFSIVRTKIFAVLLGPSGIGLIGLYNAVLSIVSILSGMGIRSSGVRQIAAAAASEDAEKIAKSVLTLRRAALVLGLCGFLLMIALSRPISRLTFRSEDYANPLSLLAITVFLSSVSGGQSALIQGMRRVLDLARMNILNALVGTLLGALVIYFFKDRGIEIYLVAVSLVSLLISWRFARKIPVRKIPVKWKESFAEARQLFSLGMVFMVSGLLSTGVPYVMRTILSHRFSLEELGIYEASSALATVYVGFILNAMALDFYPRLTAAANDNALANRLVNEQAQVGLLIAAPGVLVTIALAPFVIELFYSAKFLPAYEILRWQILGVMLRVVSWPMGYLLLAKGKGLVYFWTEFTAYSVHLLFFIVGISFYALPGAGMAFFLLYVFYTVMMAVVSFKITGFTWSSANLKTGAFLGGVVGAVFALHYLLTPFGAASVGVAASLLVGLYSVKGMCALVGVKNYNDLRAVVRRVLKQNHS